MIEKRDFAQFGSFNNNAGLVGISKVKFPTAGKKLAQNPIADSLITIWKKQGNQPFWAADDPLADVENFYNNASLQFARTYLPVGRKSRLVGGYIKVEDLTPELYQTGTVCCWRQKAEFTTSYTGIDKEGSGATCVVPLEVLSAPPASLNDALLSGGVSWDLNQGALITLAPSGPNDPTEPRGVYRGMNTNDTGVVGIQPPYGIICEDGLSFTYPAVYTALAPNLHQEFKAFDYQGVYMTGLVPETKLRLTWQLEFEVFPQPTDKEMTLATSSLPSDPRALQCMEMILRSMPPGVPAHENALGDWFKSVAGKIAQIADEYSAPLLGAIKIAAPELAPAASAAMASLRLARNMARPNKQKKNKTTQKTTGRKKKRS
jgi:hypothetical protein